MMREREKERERERIKQDWLIITFFQFKKELIQYLLFILNHLSEIMHSFYVQMVDINLHGCIIKINLKKQFHVLFSGK